MRAVVIESGRELRLAARRPFGFDFHWLRELAPGTIEGQAGLKVDAEGEASLEFAVTGSHCQELSLDERGWLRLRVLKRETEGRGFAARLSVTAQAAAPPPDAPDALAAALAGAYEGLTPAALQAVQALRDAIYRRAAEALEKKCGAELSCCYESAAAGAALLDCSYDFTEAGLAAYRQARRGDYSWLPKADSRHVEIRRGALTHGLPSEARLELHLPWLSRKEWGAGFEALARMEATSDEAGRLLVYHVEAPGRAASQNSYQSVLALAGRVHSSASFTLSFGDQRRLPCAQAPVQIAPVLRACGFDDGVIQWLSGVCAGSDGELDVSLALSIPGSLAAAWLEAPGECDSLFFPAYARVSVTVQRSLRAWLPYVYFSDLRRYEILEAALPLVVYQASRPFIGRPKYDFTYDVLSDEGMASFFRLAAQQLPKELSRAGGILLAAGQMRTAALYNPKRARLLLQSVRQKPKQLNSLLVAEAALVSALVNLGCRGRELREQAAKDPAAAEKGLSGLAAGFVKALNGPLRRLYGGQQFLALGSLLLVEATRALNGNAGVQAVLRISSGEKGLPGSIEQTLVNAAYRPVAG